jgi:hypothetical protein
MTPKDFFRPDFFHHREHEEAPRQKRTLFARLAPVSFAIATSIQLAPVNASLMRFHWRSVDDHHSTVYEPPDEVAPSTHPLRIVRGSGVVREFERGTDQTDEWVTPKDSLDFDDEEYVREE